MRCVGRLTFTAKLDSSIYFQTENEAEIGFRSSRMLGFTVIDENGCTVTDGIGDDVTVLLAEKGNYKLLLHADAQQSASISVLCDDGALAYLMPGVGVLWNHGAEFPLLLAEDTEHELWLLSHADDKTEAVAVIKGVDFGEDVRVICDGVPFSADWYPKLGRRWFWHSACLPAGVCTGFALPKGQKPVRFTAYSRTVVALCEPVQSFRFGALRVTVTDSEGNEIDARIEVFSGNERVAMQDKLCGETDPIYLPAGCYTLKVGHGVFWREELIELCLGEGDTDISVRLSEDVRLPSGWILGELHTHSSLEDATLFPRQVMRAARANGRSFCFMTDKDTDLLDKFGLHDHDLDGKFMAIPGQEIMCNEIHMNVLNPAYRIENPEADDLSRVNHDIEKKIDGWIAEVDRMKAECPCMIMHNHPTHRPEVARNSGYFRSWWASDLHPNDLNLVENCGYPDWFDRLNRGRRLFAAWTGDGHDCTLMYPGKEGVAVYTGGELSDKAIISALENGSFFSTRAPGVVLMISAEGRKVSFVAEAGTPIDTVEVVADGHVKQSVGGDGMSRVEGEITLPVESRWAIVRARLVGCQWDRSTHSFTPFMEAGYDAFTNPVFFE